MADLGLGSPVSLCMSPVLCNVTGTERHGLDLNAICLVHCSMLTGCSADTGVELGVAVVK